MDAIDSAIIELSPSSAVRLLGFSETPYSPALKQALEHLVTGSNTLSLFDFGSLSTRIAEEFAAALNELMRELKLSPSEISALGSHGQTVAHFPAAAPPFSVQLGDPGTIAVRTGITTVADFRNKDIALGGQGAPLVPPFHQVLFGHLPGVSAIVNIGGIANITLVGQAFAEQNRAFDVGPGNTLLDQWIHACLHLPHDENGGWGAGGNIAQPLLDTLLSDPYFRLPAPKSTGREYFNLIWLNRYLSQIASSFKPQDVQRTLVELTAASICRELEEVAPTCARLIVCGGGTKNDFLFRRLSELFGNTVAKSSDFGFPTEAIEAMAFAWLAHQTLNGLPGNLPSVTGANRQAVLGGIYLAT